MGEKPLVWVGSSLDDVRAFPKDARRVAGHGLHLIQMGLEPGDSKPMPNVGPGVRELRIHGGTEHRVMYVAKFAEGVYVLHAFQKKSRKAPRQDVELARARYARVLAGRGTRGAQGKGGTP